jgi:hypothetical protein
MQASVNLCTCVDSFQKAALRTHSPEIKEKLQQLTASLSGVEDSDCAQQLTPLLKCAYDQLRRCESNPEGAGCERFLQHADKILETCRTGSCC